MNGRHDVDLPLLIDSQPLSTQQCLIIALCALVALLDGLDTQSIGVAAPLIAKLFGMERPHLAPIFSAGLVGAALGAFTFGPLADRFGRKQLLVLSCLVFGLFTFLTAYCRNFEMLMACRFLTGLGLGGALPCFVAMSSEFAPARLRATVVTVTWAAFPLGGMLGGFLNAAVIERYGWEAIFYIGGIAPMLVAVLLSVLLPNSLRQEYGSAEGQVRLARMVKRMFGQAAPDDAHYFTSEIAAQHMPVKRLFSDGRAVATLMLWVPFFLAFGTLTVVVLWTPTLLGMNGISPAETAKVVACNGLGAAIGMALAGTLMQRFGTARTLVPALVIGALVTAALGREAASVPLAAMYTGLVGLFVGLGAAGVVALAAMIYPDSLRSTGTGWAMGAGRIGQAVAPLLAGALLARQWNVPDIMLVVGGAPAIAAVFVLMLRWHSGVETVVTTTSAAR